MGREDYVRDPSHNCKGLRNRFRTDLKAGPEFKYSTGIRRRHPTIGVPFLEVTLKKGNRDDFERLLVAMNLTMSTSCWKWLFEGLPVVMRP